MHPDVYAGYVKMLRELRGCFTVQEIAHVKAMDIVNLLIHGHNDPFLAHSHILVSKHEQKKLFCSYVARSIPSVEAIASISHFADRGNILEINSLRGVWAGFIRALYRLQQARSIPRVDILAPYRDARLFPYVEPLEAVGPTQFVDIEKNYVCLLFVAPTTANEIMFAQQCVEQYTGEKIVYVGGEENALYVYLRGRCMQIGYGVVPNWYDCMHKVVFFIKNGTV